MCADEMNLMPGMGAPGGDLGEFIVTLGILEEIGFDATVRLREPVRC